MTWLPSSNARRKAVAMMSLSTSPPQVAALYAPSVTPSAAPVKPRGFGCAAMMPVTTSIQLTSSHSALAQLSPVQLG